MRAGILYLLLFAVLLPSLSPWGTIAYYQLNKDYIARVLCENRSRPELHCNGQCYLAKKLKAQQEKQDKETTERVQKTPVLQLFCADLLPFQLAPAITVQQPVSRFTYTLGTYTAWLTPIFHPPGRACYPFSGFGSPHGVTPVATVLHDRYRFDSELP